VREAAEEPQVIKRYVLQPDQNGAHLREMALCLAEERMRDAQVPERDRAKARLAQLEGAAETIAGFIHLAWGGAGQAEYASRSYELLCALRDRMRGMDPKATWQYALYALTVDIEARLRRAEHLVLDPEGENDLVRHFFDNQHEYDHLHDVVEHTMQFHWERRHRPGSPVVAQVAEKNIPVGPRGDAGVETHLRRTATLAVATYIEQANIARGLVENPTDTAIVLQDRVNLQRQMGVFNSETWVAAGRKLADFIESRFGTESGRAEARTARARWKLLSKKRQATH
jgi:hypothetical protein